MLHVSAAFPHHEIHECKYSGNSHARSLHHSPFSFSFCVFFYSLSLSLLPFYFYFLSYLIFSVHFFVRSNLKHGRVSTLWLWHARDRYVFPVLMNATPHLSPIDNVDRAFSLDKSLFFPLRRTPYYKLFCAAQF